MGCQHSLLRGGWRNGSQTPWSDLRSGAIRHKAKPDIEGIETAPRPSADRTGRSQSQARHRGHRNRLLRYHRATPASHKAKPDIEGIETCDSACAPPPQQGHKAKPDIEGIETGRAWWRRS